MRASVARSDSGSMVGGRLFRRMAGAATGAEDDFRPSVSSRGTPSCEEKTRRACYIDGSRLGAANAETGVAPGSTAGELPPCRPSYRRCFLCSGRAAGR